MGIKSNLPASAYFNFFGATGRATEAIPGVVIPTPGIDASGGLINDYEDSGQYYRTHTFTSSGSFVVNSVSAGPQPDVADILVVAGGGGGASGAGWGGGAGGGGVLETTSFTLTAITYPITIGGGGSTGGVDSGNGSQGGNTVFIDPAGPTTHTATGGGYGSHPGAGGEGGSPGGPGENKPASPTNVQGSSSPFTGYGNVAGHPSGPNSAVGGGGAGSSSISPATKYPSRVTPNGPTPIAASNAVGGQGRPNTFSGPGNQLYTYGGGGGGANFDYDRNNTWGTGTLDPTAPSDYPQAAGDPAAYMTTAPPDGGGGSGVAYWRKVPLAFRNGEAGYGGGGGGGLQPNGLYVPGGDQPTVPSYPSPSTGGNGGSGTVIVRYKIESGQSGTAKATGGNISYSPTRTIHTFTSSGTFTTTADWTPVSVDYMVVGGGGAGGTSNSGNSGGGGGGAGGVLVGTLPIGAHPVATTVTVGAGGAGAQVQNMSPTVPANYTGNPGTNSTLGPTITAIAGGGGGSGTSPKNAVSGGSGGGGGGDAGDGGEANGSTYPGSPPATSPPTGWSSDGGTTPGPTHDGGAGGGGAGGAGEANGGTKGGGSGGIGMQVPDTFIVPGSTAFGSPPPTGSGRWIAGGGGGATYLPGSPPGGSGGGGGGLTPSSTAALGYAGGGHGETNYVWPRSASDPKIAPLYGNGWANTGAGGGGSSNYRLAYEGGSGVVIISYPT